jgi:hypothetical protein
VNGVDARQTFRGVVMEQPSTVADSALLIDVVRAVVDRTGELRWAIQPAPMWCHVTSPSAGTRQHGWKLHVSATPLSAPLVLARAAEVLVRHGCTFKFGIDLSRVAELVSDWYDRGSSGKFITAYPEDDEQFRTLAEELHRVTKGLPGPRILSDRTFRSGSLVHFRYGEFRNNRVFTDDGLFESRMVGPDGSIVKDERKAWFSPPPWAASPFPEEAVTADAAPDSVLLRGRYRIRQAIRHANKGGVYRALDERSDTEVIIKQARSHIGASLAGTDVRDRLRKEARLLDELAPLAVTPAKLDLFEEQGDLFLVQELLPGRTLSEWAAERAQDKPDVADVADVTAVALRLVTLMRTFHEADLVIRDFKPQNLMVSPFDEIHLIDVELVSHLGNNVGRAGTPGYIAPEVDASAELSTPGQQSDCFSLGVTLFCAATALAPTLVSGQSGTIRSAAERRELLSQIATTSPSLTALIEPIVGLTETDPDLRWSSKQAEEYLRNIGDIVAEPLPLTGGSTELVAVDRLLADGLTHLHRGMTPNANALWPRQEKSRDYDGGNLWTGAAGPLATLTRAARLIGDTALRETVAQAASWLDERLFSVPRLIPGLCFGRAGTAWALHDAARLLEDDRLAERAVELAKRLPVQWTNSDVTHGLSGAGLAHLHLWRVTGDPELGERAIAYADAVLAAAHRDGDDWLWPTSVNADSKLAGTSSYGFAHGIAGVGAFLLAVARQCGSGQRYLRAALGAGETLARSATVDRYGIAWPTSVGGSVESGGHWCTGPAGIGTFLIRLWAVTEAQRFRDLAEQCAAAAVRQMWTSGTSACCGLSGVGHFLLDLAEFTHRDDYRAQASAVAIAINAQHQVHDGLRVVLGAAPESGYGYGYGSAGVLDFLLRLRHGGPRPWLPREMTRGI